MSAKPFLATRHQPLYLSELEAAERLSFKKEPE